MIPVCNKPMTLCWFCKKATCSGCSWSARFEPVVGWVAEPTTLTQHSGSNKKMTGIDKIIPSFHVISCPEYLEG